MTTYRGCDSVNRGQTLASDEALQQAVDAAEAWAQHPFNVPVPTWAGANGTTDFSALHWATLSEQDCPDNIVDEQLPNGSVTPNEGVKILTPERNNGAGYNFELGFLDFRFENTSSYDTYGSIYWTDKNDYFRQIIEGSVQDSVDGTGYLRFGLKDSAGVDSTQLVISENNGVQIDGETVAVLNSPAFTGIPTAPTAAPLTNTTQIATTAYVDAVAFTGLIEGLEPSLIFKETDSTLDEKYWTFSADGGIFYFRAFNDAYTLANSVFAVTRNGYVPTGIVGYIDLNLRDNADLSIGTGQDLILRHDVTGSTNYIDSKVPLKLATTTASTIMSVETPDSLSAVKTVAEFGGATPLAQLFYDGIVKFRTTFDGIELPATSTESRNIEIGKGRSGDGSSWIDLIGDTTYADYGLRILRNFSATGGSEIRSRGTGDFVLQTQDAADITFETTSLERGYISSAGGLVWGAPTGGDLGAGTINAESVNVNGIPWLSGTGSPEGVVTAPVGALYSNTTGGANTTLYVKESGVGNTGWIAK